MECPKCGFEIDDNATVCPNCKKVLKLICPVCKTVNRENICKKCGYVIVTKCSNCGKVALVKTKKCRHCGNSLEKSVIINESNTDNFAVLKIDFTNMDKIRKALNSPRLYSKFKSNLDKMITEFLKTVGLRRQIIDKSFVIRFNKDYSFNSSAGRRIKRMIFSSIYFFTNFVETSL